ncbi:MAG: MFS transporter [Carbonactinosporaceae bacterium]
MSDTAVKGHSSLRAVLAATVAGTAMEWYDFYLYATASALVFDKIFFPNLDPIIGTIASFGTFAAGFFIRPLGGIYFGQLGDKIGRRNVLVITLLLMGVATTLIGLVPNYATIGLAAPILLTLFRLLQGFGAGAEYAGAVIMAAEYSPKPKRGFYSAIPYVGVSIGLLASTGLLALVSSLPEEQMLSWGWRIPFLLSALIAGVGLYIRFRVLETPVFDEVKKRHDVIRVPLKELWLKSKRPLLACWGARLGDNSLAYIFESFVIVYVTKTLGLPEDLILNGLMIAAFIQIVTVPAFGALTDRIGRRPVYAGGAIASAAFAYPFYLLMDTENRLIIWAALIVAAAGFKSAMTGAQAIFFAELFPARYRYSGFAIGREVTSPIAGGLTPLITTSIYAATGEIWPVALYVVGLCVITAGSVLAVPETYRTSLEIPETAPAKSQ